MASYACNCHHGWRMQAAWTEILFGLTRLKLELKKGGGDLLPILIGLTLIQIDGFSIILLPFDVLLPDNGCGNVKYANLHVLKYVIYN